MKCDDLVLRNLQLSKSLHATKFHIPVCCIQDTHSSIDDCLGKHLLLPKSAGCEQDIGSTRGICGA